MLLPWTVAWARRSLFLLWALICIGILFSAKRYKIHEPLGGVSSFRENGEWNFREQDRVDEVVTPPIESEAIKNDFTDSPAIQNNPPATIDDSTSSPTASPSVSPMYDTDGLDASRDAYYGMAPNCGLNLRTMACQYAHDYRRRRGVRNDISMHIP